MANFYTNVAISGKHILYRGVENGKRVKRKVEYHPTLYVPSATPTEFTTLKGEFVSPHKAGTIPECKDFIERYKDVSNFKVYGNDRFVYSYIGDTFTEKVEWDISKIVIAYLDIEVNASNGFPEPEDAKECITAITMKFGEKVFTFGLKEYTSHRKDISYARCEDEMQLLTRFIDFWTFKCPDIVSGWNVKYFDMPYLINRIRNVLGDEEAKKISSWNKYREKRTTLHDRDVQYYDIDGMSILDCMIMYEKFTDQKRESYSLEYISQVEFGEGKIDYSEYGGLSGLYDNNHQLYIEYNIRDVDLVEKIVSKRDLIRLALTLAYDSKTNYTDVFSQVRMWDAIIYNHLKEKKVVIPQAKYTANAKKFVGGFVKEPVPGMYEWVVSFDLNSLYPHLIMMYNMSMETFVEPFDYTQEMMDLVFSGDVSIDSLLEKKVDIGFLKEQNICLTPNNQFFRRETKGALAEIMETMYIDRSKYKKLAIEARKKVEDIELEMRKRGLKL